MTATPTSARPTLERSVERRRAALLARHLRDVEGLTIAQIAERIGRRPNTVKGYLYDPDGSKARTVKERLRGTCEVCGAPTTGSDGKGKTRHYCTQHKGEHYRRWTREKVIAAMLEWKRRHGQLPSSTDWSITEARRRGAQALARLRESDWPRVATVVELFGSWRKAWEAAEAALRSQTPARHDC